MHFRAAAHLASNRHRNEFLGGRVVLAVSRFRYQSRRNDEPLLTRLVELAQEKQRYGYRRLLVLLTCPRYSYQR
jgi:hypothetical protein